MDIGGFLSYKIAPELLIITLLSMRDASNLDQGTLKHFTQLVRLISTSAQLKTKFKTLRCPQRGQRRVLWVL
jgi:hypothetical protein